MNRCTTTGPMAKGPAKQLRRVRTILIAFAGLAVALAGAIAFMPGRALAADPPHGVPATAEGTCHIGSTWMVGTQSFFTIPSFSGMLESAVPSSTFECLDHTAAAPEDVDATYAAELVGYSFAEGWAEYYVTITPPGVTDGETSNEFGLIGYQRVGGKVRIPWDFAGGIDLVKRSSNAAMTDGNRCYSLQGAMYGVFETRDAAAAKRAGDALATYSTNADGRWSSRMDLSPATYYVTELRAPEGYALDGAVYEVTVPAGARATVNAGAGFVTDAPKSNPVTLWAAKVDAESPDGKAQGSATLAGALFEVRYYDGYYDAQSLPESPTRRWVVATDGDGRAVASDDLKVEGDDFYRTGSGEIALPLGTVTVRELEAPRGYLPDDGGVRVITISASGTTQTLSAYTAPTFADRVQRGGVVVGKVDRQNGEYLPQGSATLAGATFTVESANSQPVSVDGTFYANGDIVMVMESELDEGGRYVAGVDGHCLPVGNYVVRESASSPGYRYDGESSSWNCAFEITEDGQLVDLTGEGQAVPNQVVRGDFSFSKANGETGTRLAHVPFLVTSKTTGESHVVVTDENGMASTAADWNSHAGNANGNDAALAEAEGGYVVDEEALDPLAGVWFNGRVDAACAPDDALGALPYDTYTVTELPVSANEGLTLVTFDVRISRDGRELDLGTVDDNAGPLVGTSLADENGVKLVPAGSVQAVTDTVEFANLDPAQRYTMRGELHLVTPDGEDGGVVAQGSTVFQPGTPTSTVGVDFSVDTAELAGARLVAFEQLVDEGGMVVASHEDLMYEGQTVRVPAIGTTIANKADGGKTASADEPVELVDTVSYQGLTPGDTYTLTGTLHVRGEDGGDGGVATDAGGQPITAKQSFTAEDSTGTVQVTFTFAAPDLGGKTVVAFEELTRRGAVYATHADIGDEGQTIQLTKTPAEPTETAEEDEPGPTPEQPKPAPEKQPEGEEAKPMAVKGALPATGDALPWLPIAALAAGAAGIGGATLCVRSLQRGKEIRINRGPQRR